MRVDALSTDVLRLALPTPGMSDDRSMDDQLPPLTHINSLDELLDSRRAHARAAISGEEIRIARGVYVSSNAWGEIENHDRYLLRIRGVVNTRHSRPVVSHWSAAAIHGLPIGGNWLQDVHTTVSPTAGGRSHNGVVKHHAKLSEEDVVEIDGMLVTSVARTVVDIAMMGPFAAAVVVADRAQLVDRFGRTPPMTTREEIQNTFNRLMPVRAHKRAQGVIDFSVNRSESPLESESRVSMRIIGCPQPALQVPFWDYRGFIGESDFGWEEYNSVGEADGKQKYFEERFRRGRTSQQVIDDERIRHNRLAALPKHVIRWGWETGTVPARLRAHLVAAGLPMGVKWK